MATTLTENITSRVQIQMTKQRNHHLPVDH